MPIVSKILPFRLTSLHHPQLPFNWWLDHHYGPRLMRLQRYMVYPTYVWPLMIILAMLIGQWELLRRCRYGSRFESSSASIIIGDYLSRPRVFWPPHLQTNCLAGNMISPLLAKLTKVIGPQMVSQVCFVDFLVYIFIALQGIPLFKFDSSSISFTVIHTSLMLNGSISLLFRHLI